MQWNAAAPPRGETEQSEGEGRGGAHAKMAWRRSLAGGVPPLSWSHMPVLASSGETVKGVGQQGPHTGQGGRQGIPANRLAFHCPVKGPFSSGCSCGNRETRSHVSACPVPILPSKAVARARPCSHLPCFLQPPGTAVPGNAKGHQPKLSAHLEATGTFLKSETGIWGKG